MSPPIHLCHYCLKERACCTLAFSGSGRLWKFCAKHRDEVLARAAADKVKVDVRSIAEPR